jgi:uncharacterized protein (TIGR00251 family)
LTSSPADAAAVREDARGVLLEVKVVPRASRDRIAGLVGDRIKVQLTAPPVEGAANEALRVLLARALDVPRSAVEIVRGETGRSKTLHIDGVTRARVLALLDGETT